MGSMTFTRRDGASGEVLQKYSFDSSPQYTIAKTHGFAKDSVRLIRTGGNDREDRYDVHASSTEDGRTVKVGELTAMTRAAIWGQL